MCTKNEWEILYYALRVYSFLLARGKKYSPQEFTNTIRLVYAVCPRRDACCEVIEKMLKSITISYDGSASIKFNPKVVYEER